MAFLVSSLCCSNLFLDNSSTSQSRATHSSVKKTQSHIHKFWVLISNHIRWQARFFETNKFVVSLDLLGLLNIYIIAFQLLSSICIIY